MYAILPFGQDISYFSTTQMNRKTKNCSNKVTNASNILHIFLQSAVVSEIKVIFFRQQRLICSAYIQFNAAVQQDIKTGVIYPAKVRKIDDVSVVNTGKIHFRKQYQKTFKFGAQMNDLIFAVDIDII